MGFLEAYRAGRTLATVYISAPRHREHAQNNRKSVSHFLFRIGVDIAWFGYAVKAPIMNWPSVWSQSFKQALIKRVKEISPDAKHPQNNLFDEANIHHSANKAADRWYRDFLLSKDHKLNQTANLKLSLIHI